MKKSPPPSHPPPKSDIFSADNYDEQPSGRSHDLGKKLEVIVVILNECHSRQADTVAREMHGFNAKMLAGWMKSKKKSGSAPPIRTSTQRWVIETFPCPHLKVGKQRKVLGLVSYNNYY